MLECVGEVRAVRGAVVFGSLPFEGRAVPVVLASGAGAGPTLLVVGLQHTGEFPGPAATDAVLAGLDCGELRGTLVCLPVANPLNYSAALDPVERRSEGPEANINRQWPGDPASGNALSRLAALLWEKAVSRADAVVDLHSCRICDPFFAAALAGHRASEELAAAVGFGVLDMQTPQSYAPNLLFMEAAGRLGIPAVLTETHPDGFQPEYAVKACSAALLNAMRHLGMLALPGVAPAGAATAQPVIFERAVPGVELKPGTGGYLGVRRWAGERVGRGDVVAEVRSAETFEVVERLVSPLDGAVSCVGDPGGSGFVKAGVTAAVVKPVRRAR